MSSYEPAANPTTRSIQPVVAQDPVWQIEPLAKVPPETTSTVPVVQSPAANLVTQEGFQSRSSENLIEPMPWEPDILKELGQSAQTNPSAPGTRVNSSELRSPQSQVYASGGGGKTWEESMSERPSQFSTVSQTSLQRGGNTQGTAPQQAQLNRHTTGQNCPPPLNASPDFAQPWHVDTSTTTDKDDGALKPVMSKTKALKNCEETVARLEAELEELREKEQRSRDFADQFERRYIELDRKNKELLKQQEEDRQRHAEEFEALSELLEEIGIEAAPDDGSPQTSNSLFERLRRGVSTSVRPASRSRTVPKSSRSEWR